MNSYAGKLERWLEETEARRTQQLLALLRIPSVSVETPGMREMPFGQNCRQALDYCRSAAEAAGLPFQDHEGYCGTVLLRGRTEETVGIFCHIDVVPEGTGWTRPPYEPYIRDGFVYGRGATDNKGPAISMLHLLEFLKEQVPRLRHSVLLYFGCAEETGMKDLKWYLEHFEAPMISLTPDSQFPVCCGEKTHITGSFRLTLPEGIRSLSGGTAANAVAEHAQIVLRNCRAELFPCIQGLTAQTQGDDCVLTMRGCSAHAAMPETGKDAISLLCRLAADSGWDDPEAKQWLRTYARVFSDYHGTGCNAAFSDEVSGKLTLVNGMVRGSDGVCTGTIDVRCPVTSDGEDVIRRITETLCANGFSQVDLKSDPGYYYSLDHPLMTTLNRAACTVLGREMEPFVIGGGTYARLLPMGAAFGHLQRWRRRPGGGGHQADECLQLEGMKDLMRVYLETLLLLEEIPDHVWEKTN